MLKELEEEWEVRSRNAAFVSVSYVEGAGGRRGKWIGRGLLDGLAEMREA